MGILVTGLVKMAQPFLKRLVDELGTASQTSSSEPFPQASPSLPSQHAPARSSERLRSGVMSSASQSSTSLCRARAVVRELRTPVSNARSSERRDVSANVRRRRQGQYTLRDFFDDCTGDRSPFVYAECNERENHWDAGREPLLLSEL